MCQTRRNPLHFASIADGSGSVPCLSLPTSVFVCGDDAYVTSAGSTALEIVNVTIPANPAHFGRLDNGNGIAPFPVRSTKYLHIR